MKISKKLLPVFVIAAMLFSSCGIFNKEHRSQRHCDCPKFGQATDQPADEQDGATADIGE